MGSWLERKIGGRTGVTYRKRLLVSIVVVAVCVPFIAWRLLDRRGFDANEWRLNMDPDVVFAIFTVGALMGLAAGAVALRAIVAGRGGEVSGSSAGPVLGD